MTSRVYTATIACSCKLGPDPIYVCRSYTMYSFVVKAFAAHTMSISLYFLWKKKKIVHRSANRRQRENKLLFSNGLKLAYSHENIQTLERCRYLHRNKICKMQVCVCIYLSSMHLLSCLRPWFMTQSLPEGLCVIRWVRAILTQFIFCVHTYVRTSASTMSREM